MSDKVESLRRQLADAEDNLRLIEEQKLKAVTELEIPPTLVKDERRLRKQIGELREGIQKAEAEEPPSTVDSTLVPATSDQVRQQDQKAVRARRRWRVAGVAVVTVLGLAVLLGIGVAIGFRIRGESLAQSQVPAVALVGMSYQVGHWDPRRIDLSRAAESGIPVEADRMLEFLDLSVSVAEDAPDYVAVMEVYEDPQLTVLVGASESFPLIKGNQRLPSIRPTKYATEPSSDPNENDVWKVPPEWIGDTLRVALVVYRRGQARPVHIATTEVRLEPGGDAWFVSPPNATLASVAYSVNEGPIRIVDFREVGQMGLDAQPNDTLTIEEIWYTSNASGGILHAEAYLTKDEFNRDTYRSAGRTVASQGTRPLTGLSPLTWVVPAESDKLVLSLVRDDGVVLDRLMAELNGANGSRGLVPQ